VMDREMRYVHCNKAVEKRFGVKPSDQVGKTLTEILGAEKAAQYARYVREVFDSGEPVRYEDSRMLFGSFFCSETVLSPIFGRDGQIEAVTGVSRDITKRRLSEQALRESEERLALAIKGSNDGLWDWNLKSNEIYYSPRWKEMLGYEEHEISSEPAEWFSRIHPQDGVRVQSELDSHLKEPMAYFESEYRVLHKDGTYRWMLARGTSIRDGEGAASRVAGSQSDITVRKAAEEQLVRGAYHDALTGLPNRILFTESLTRSVARARRRPDYQFAVLFLDLDRFKLVNDSLGHAIGDQLLVHVARRLEECMRPGDIVARLGGDEFTVLLEDVPDASNAVQIAERILARVGMPLSLSGHEVYSTVSIGIALSSPAYEAADDLIRDADAAMYRAKSLGKARYELFAEKARDSSSAHQHTETELRRAVARRQFALRYLPVVHLETGRICGFEALLRWNHPSRGLLSPFEFLKLADESGMLIPIGWWTIREAASWLAVWNEQFPSTPPLRVSVNLTSRQFNHPALISLISHTVSRSKLPPQSLVLEVSESAVSNDWLSLAEQTAKLKQLQVQLYLDNFGAGTSSLSFLNRVLVDALKVDRSFVLRLGPTGENRGILKAIMAIAQELRIPAIAEGVETAAQASTLRTLGCTYGQGYYFSEPLTADEATKLLAQSPHFH
jgi:diguanylate cyclase (GGDEF)-like protein/PAS domain S-box-containing protein